MTDLVPAIGGRDRLSVMRSIDKSCVILITSLGVKLFERIMISPALCLAGSGGIRNGRGRTSTFGLGLLLAIEQRDSGKAALYIGRPVGLEGLAVSEGAYRT
jgi:hypothetical protein